ncbi:hypothetical protein [Neobacillus niacini]|uniref:hypothetical protein n=1 Tax=Neobacillus niacini TaxID=86668 RepID=UPI00203CFECA|nr:hypothetical protein [Neobacillus niacini]MCM3694137.1 hypothetical protein [Neobacillus niacini]
MTENENEVGFQSMQGVWSDRDWEKKVVVSVIPLVNKAHHNISTKGRNEFCYVLLNFINIYF